MPPIFLDTTIHMERLLSTLGQRRTIQENLRERKIYTSSTVYMEFKRGILQDTYYIRSLIAKNEPLSTNSIRLSDIDRWLASAEGNFSTRSRDRCKLVTAAIKDEFLDPNVQQAELLIFLEGFAASLNYYFFNIDLGNEKYFDIQAERTYIDQAGCVLSLPDFPPGDILNHRLSCRAGKTDCRIADFLAIHEQELNEIYVHLSTLPKSQRDAKAFSVLQDIIQNGFEKATGQRSCWALGDIIIALESPYDALIYTTNERHFAPLCQALGKSLYKKPTVDN